MFAAPFSRMLWKEYRSLRMLWFGCALGTLGLWLLMYVVGVLNSHTSEPPLELMHAFWSLALWLPAIYLLGCTVATFAGEKEERTADWLIHTAKPFGATFTAKVIWPVLSAGAMQLLLFGAAALIREYFLQIHQRGPLPADETMPELPALATFTLLEALAWGLFWSLQLSKPMPAAVLAALCIVLVNMGTLNYHGATVWEPYLAPWSILRTAGLAILFLMDIGLARRWLAGRGWEWSIPWDRFVIHRSETHVMPAVEQAVPWRRAWQRFRWLEFQSIRIFLMFTVLWALVTGIPTFIWPQRVGPGPTIFAIFFLPLFAGIAAWQGEQSRFQFRFLAYRGVSPYGLWLSKFLRWLVALVAAVVVVFILGTLIQESGLAVFQQGSNFSDRLNRVFQGMDPTSAVVSVCAYLTLFVSAFTVSLYFRRGIFAFGAGLILHIALIYWCFATYYLNLPVWFGVLPLTAWLLWCGLRQLPRWYLERAGWRWNAIIAAEWLVFPMLFSAAVISYWVYSVPMPNIPSIMASNPRPLSTGSGTQLFAEWDDVRQRAYLLANRRNELLGSKNLNLPDSINLTDVPAEQWTSLEPEVKAFRTAVLKPNGMSPSTEFAARSASNGLHMNSRDVILPLIQLADQDVAAGKLDDAILDIRTAVRYAGALEADKALNIYTISSSNVPSILYSALERWVRRPDVTPELVQRTLAELQSHELRWWLTDPLQLELLHAAELKELDRIETSLGFRGWFLKPWLARQRRLTACELSNQLRFLRTPFTGSQGNPLTPGMNFNDPDPAWSYRSHQQPYAYSMAGYNIPVGLSPDFLFALRDRETQIRCTFAMLAAEAYRKGHDQLPSDFSAVVPQIASRELLTDPWSGELLQIRPHGVPGELNTGTGFVRTIKPNVPFLWSVGPFAHQIRERTLGHPGPKYFDLLPTRVWNPYPTRPVSYVFPLWTEAKPEANADQPADAARPDRQHAESMMSFGGGGALILDSDDFSAEPSAEGAIRKDSDDPHK